MTMGQAVQLNILHSFSFNSYSNLVREVPLLSPFYRCGNEAKSLKLTLKEGHEEVLETLKQWRDVVSNGQDTVEISSFLGHIRILPISELMVGACRSQDV